MRSGSRQHRGEAGGGGYGFPPLLATDGRNHKGDCDMRTGAIFARGSCRALKWMAVLGLVFALGAGSAFAQVDATDPTLNSASFEPGTNEVTVTASEDVYGAPDASDFTFTGGTGALAALTVNSVVISSAVAGADNEFMLIVSAKIPTGTTGLALAYTQPAAAKRIKDIAGNAVADTASITFAEGDGEPELPAVDPQTANEGDDYSIRLPAAVGGNGTITYTLLAGDGTEIDDDPSDAPADSDAANLGLTFTDDRWLRGTVGEEGEYTLRYQAEDAASPGTQQTDEVRFTFTVNAEGTIPTTGIDVTVKSVTAAASVAEGGSLEVKVTATLPAGEGLTIPMKTVMLTFPADHSTIKEGEGAEEADFAVLSDTTLKNIKLDEEKSEKTYTFRVEVRRDLDAEDEKYQVSAKIDGDAVKTKDVLMIDDAQTQSYTLTLPSAAKGAIMEGAEDATKLTLKADPPRTMNIPVFMAMNPNDPARYSLTFSDDGMFGMDKTSVTADIKAMADKDRSEDMVTVTAYTGTPSNNMELASLDIKVTDANPLPGVRARLVDEDGEALDPQPMSVTEGETVMLVLTAVDKDGDSMEASEKLTVSLMPAGTAGVQDYRLSAHPIEIADGSASSAAVDLMVLADDDVGEEMLTFDAVVSGDEKVGPGSNSVMGVLSLMIEDGTMKLVWAKSMDDVQAQVYAAKGAGAGADEIFAMGEMIELDASTLFNYAEGVTLDYVASTDSDAVSVATSGKMVTVTAAKAGMAHVTITAHANTPAGVKIVAQTEPDEASIVFPVEVGLEALSIMLSGPEDMNLAEGKSATVTATANRAVTADTTVMLMRDRAMSSAGEDDYTVEDITIMAGEMSGSTMVMAVEDNMAEDMEELVLYGMTEGMAGEVTGEVHLHLWDAAVPALPIIAQLLLAFFLAIGGYRRYLRR